MLLQDTMLNISETIKLHRKAAQLTQHELANLAGVGKTVVFDIEHAKPSVQLDSLLKVCKILNIRLTLQGPFMVEPNGETS